MLEFLIVGRSPLGSAVRAGVLGALFGLIGGFLFGGRFWGAVFAIAAITIVLPIIYAISKRDNPALPEPQKPETPAKSVEDRWDGQTIPILPTRILDDTAAFWNRLGFHERARYTQGQGYLLMKRGEMEFHFFEFPELDPKANYAGAYIEVTDADTLHAEYAALGLPGEGIPRLGPIKDEPWGMREFHLVDSDGSILRFGTPSQRRS